MPTTKSPRVLCIVGPTCTGKTALAVEIARRISTEIISADSRQIFRELDIGTAKPPREILQEVPHHFVDSVDPTETYSAGQFGHDAARVVSEIIGRHRMPIIAGGSGLYIRALIDGIHTAPVRNEDIRAQLDRRIATEGVDALLEELRRCDPVTASTIQMKHRRRIVRALEVFMTTGIPLSTWQQERTARAFAAEMIGLRWDRTELYARINMRADEMIGAGLLEEVRALQDRGYTDALQSLNTPGYKEFFAFLRGEHTFERAIELIKQHTRNFAKRQTTWFNANPRIQWIAINASTDFETLADQILAAH